MHDGRCHSSVVILVALAAAACGSGGGTESQASLETEVGPPPAASSPAGADMEATGDQGLPADLIGSWTLVEIDGAPVTEVGKTPTLEIVDDGSASGVGGVNRFQTQLKLVDGRMSFGPVAATKMAGPPEAMDLENTYFTRLGAVSSYEIDGETLRLWAGDDEGLTLKRTEE
jgi:heat shock protein HslJ